MKLVFLFLSLLALVSCGRKSGNTTRVGASGSGYGSPNSIYGKVTIYSSCGSGPALIQLGDSQGYQMQSQSVPNGGTFSFQVSAGALYHLAASTSLCIVSTRDSAPRPAGDASICLSMNAAVECRAYQKSSLTATAQKVTANQKLSMDKDSGFCRWNTWGCESGPLGETGSVFESRLLVNAKKQSRVDLEFEYAEGNRWLFSSPAFDGNKWSVDARPEGLMVGEVSYPALTVRSQISRASLQFDSGFCGKSAELPARIDEYARLQGFSETARAELASQAKAALPEADGFCAYPQEEGQIAKSLTLKATKPVEIRRLWFLMVPRLTTAQLKKTDKAPPAAKPKNDALVAARKASVARSVANAAELGLEDLGLGFLVQAK